MTPRGPKVHRPPDNTSIVLRYMLYSGIARPASTIEFSSPTFTFSGRSHLRYGNYPQQQQVELRGVGRDTFLPQAKTFKKYDDGDIYFMHDDEDATLDGDLCLTKVPSTL